MWGTHRIRVALPLSVVTSDEISNELTYKGLVHIPQIDTDIPAIVFAYPWFISHFGVTDDLLSERHLVCGLRTWFCIS